MRNDPRYAANTIRWPVGSLVIHYADAKQSEMLMEVIGYRRDGCAVTRYISPVSPGGYVRSTKKKWYNDIQYLLDPAKFGIER